MISKGKLDRIRALDVSHTANLNETSLLKFIRQRGRLIEGLAVAGKPRLAEQFFVNVIPLMKRIRYAPDFASLMWAAVLLWIIVT